jgi:hypothetical protein
VDLFVGWRYERSVLAEVPHAGHRSTDVTRDDARPPWRVVVRGACRDLVLPVVVTAAVALALVPVPRPLAWLALLGLAAALGAVTRAMGGTAAVAAGLLYMTAHGRPRVAAVVTDQSTIRLSFLLGLLGAIAAALVNWQVQQRRAHVPLRWEHQR